MANPLSVEPTAAAPTSPARPPFNFKAILQQMVQSSASDLHLKVGRPPTLRVHGELSPLPLPALRPEDLSSLAKEIMSPKQVKEFTEYPTSSAARSPSPSARFRTRRAPSRICTCRPSSRKSR
jgi:Tfp pilus assembly pilus retraction ATPase PilT